MLVEILAGPESAILRLWMIHKAHRQISMDCGRNCGITEDEQMMDAFSTFGLWATYMQVIVNGGHFFLTFSQVLIDMMFPDKLKLLSLHYGLATTLDLQVIPL